MAPTTTLETRDLRLVRAIAEAGGVTRAARALHLSQSAVSYQLKDLEGRLGLSLFTRVGRGVRMTEAGARLLAASHEVLEALSRVEGDLRAGTGRPRTLRVATQCQTAYYWLPQVLGEFEQLHPDVVFRIVPDATGDPTRALADGDIDLALLFERPKDRRLQTTPLFRDEIVAVLWPAHPLARKPFLEGGDLTDQTLVMPEVPRAMQEHVRSKLFANGGAFRKAMRVPLTEVIVELVRAGRGISLLPSWSVSGPVSRRELVAVRLTRRGIVRSWRAAWTRRSGVDDAVATLARLLRRT